MSEIFISYKSEEKEVARQLAAALESEGRAVWWDRELITGEDIDVVIERAMKEARCVIVIWSKLAVQSGYVIDEARFALKKKKLFPVQIEAVELPFRFDNMHIHSLAGWDGRASHPMFKELAADIQKYCDGNEAARGTTTETEPQTDSGFDWAKWKRPLAIALVLLLLVPVALLIAPQFMGRNKALTDEQEIKLKVLEGGLENIEAKFPEQDRLAREARPDIVWRDPAEPFRDCDQCPLMVAVPRGHFRMGSVAGEDDEKPVHVVAIHHRLAVGMNEVTRGEFQAFVKANPDFTIGGACLLESDADGSLMNTSSQNWWEPGFDQDDSHPVVCVSWNHAIAYTDWLNSMVDGEPYRLPSEAEWEYAARSSKTTRYWWGDDMMPNRANCENCGNPGDNKGTTPVGSFAANIWSLADTAGNVGEWVRDCKNNNYEGAPEEGESWESGDCTYRGIRGGRWSTNKKSVRPAARNWFLKGKQVNSIGFRVVRSPP